MDHCFAVGDFKAAAPDDRNVEAAVGQGKPVQHQLGTFQVIKRPDFLHE